jgi:hypothetical protein
VKTPPKTFAQFLAGVVKPRKQTPEQIKAAFRQMMGVPQEAAHE